MLFDGMFFGDGELFGRDISEVFYLFILESMDWFLVLFEYECVKICFIYFNYINLVINFESEVSKSV